MVNKPRTEAQSQYVLRETPRPSSPSLMGSDPAMQALYDQLPPEVQAMFTEADKHAFAVAMTTKLAEMGEKGTVKVVLNSMQLYADLGLQASWLEQRVAGTSREHDVEAFLNESMVNLRGNLHNLNQLAAAKIAGEIVKPLEPKDPPKPEKRSFISLVVRAFTKEENHTDNSEFHGATAAAKKGFLYGSKIE